MVQGEALQMRMLQVGPYLVTRWETTVSLAMVYVRHAHWEW